MLGAAIAFENLSTLGLKASREVWPSNPVLVTAVCFLAGQYIN